MIIIKIIIIKINNNINNYKNIINVRIITTKVTATVSV